MCASYVSCGFRVVYWLKDTDVVRSIIVETLFGLFDLCGALSLPLVFLPLFVVAPFTTKSEKLRVSKDSILLETLAVKCFTKALVSDH